MGADQYIGSGPRCHRPRAARENVKMTNDYMAALRLTAMSGLFEDNPKRTGKCWVLKSWRPNLHGWTGRRIRADTHQRSFVQSRCAPPVVFRVVIDVPDSVTMYSYVLLSSISSVSSRPSNRHVIYLTIKPLAESLCDNTFLLTTSEGKSYGEFNRSLFAMRVK
jgi:hypothetical protein